MVAIGESPTAIVIKSKESLRGEMPLGALEHKVGGDKYSDLELDDFIVFCEEGEFEIL
jgi:hypothetical protein